MSEYQLELELKAAAPSKGGRSFKSTLNNSQLRLYNKALRTIQSMETPPAWRDALNIIEKWVGKRPGLSTLKRDLQKGDQCQ